MVIDIFSLTYGKFLVIEKDCFGNIDFSLGDSSMVYVQGDLESKGDLARLMMTISGLECVLNQFEDGSYITITANKPTQIVVRIYGNTLYSDISSRIRIFRDGSINVSQKTAVELIGNKAFRREFYKYLPLVSNKCI